MFSNGHDPVFNGAPVCEALFLVLPKMGHFAVFLAVLHAWVLEMPTLPCITVDVYCLSKNAVSTRIRLVLLYFFRSIHCRVYTHPGGLL